MLKLNLDFKLSGRPGALFFVLVFLLSFVVFLINVAIAAAGVMLVFMALHAIWPEVPAFGFWESALIATGLMIVRGLIFGNKSA